MVYTYRKSGLEQNVIPRQAPPDPEDFGMQAKATRLEVLTEFFEAPSPKVRVLDQLEDLRLRAAMAGPDWANEELDFGPLRMEQGRALSLGQWLKDSVAGGIVPVGKR